MPIKENITEFWVLTGFGDLPSAIWTILSQKKKFRFSSDFVNFWDIFADFFFSRITPPRDLPPP